MDNNIITNKKDYFDNLLLELSEPIYLTNRIDELDKEIYHNLWILSAPTAIVEQITTSDILGLIQKVKDKFKYKLAKSELDVDLIFYLWFEDIGQLRFNFINSNHKNLPFGCKIKFVDKPEDIINLYLESKHHDGLIPWEELQDIETSQQFVESEKLHNEIIDNFVLTVYKEIIYKQVNN